MLSTPPFAAHVADAVREPLLVLDGALVVIAANRAFYRVFSVTPAETIGAPMLKLGDGQWNRPEFRSLLEDVLPRQSEFEEFEIACEFPHIGKRVMWLSGREIVASFATGTRTILLAIEDVTERRITEAALAARTRELEASNRELERFAAVASHDLEEPLRKIRTYGELLRERCASTLDERGRHYVERMSQAAGRMQALIEDVLSLSRVTAQSRPLLLVELSHSRTWNCDPDVDRQPGVCPISGSEHRPERAPSAVLSRGEELDGAPRRDCSACGAPARVYG